MTSTGTIAGASISHTRATVDQLEAATAPSQREAVLDLLDAGAEEAYVLQTCNRVEGYVVGDTAEDGQAALGALVGDTPEELVVRMDHTESLRHLLRVAAGLESLVVGEDQILGQVRDAYEDARGVGGIDTILEDGVTKALRVGERARTETAINEGVVSLASAAARLAAEDVDLETATGLVVGAGEMGTLAAKTLAGRVEELVVANRTVPHAEHVAAQVDHDDAGAVGLDDLPEAVGRADLVVTATGSEDAVLGQETLAGAGESFVVDLGQPRNVPPAATEMPGVTVRDLDALEAVTERTREQRQRAA